KKPILDYGPAEELVKRCDPSLKFGGQRAYYDRLGDYIRLPERKKFVTSAGYYSTLLHEVGHWTGHTKRLNRLTGAIFGSKEYAFEELVAELGSCFLLARLGVPERLDEHPDYLANHAAYVKSWVSCLENDEKAIWEAARLASRWNDYVLKLN